VAYDSERQMLAAAAWAQADAEDRRTALEQAVALTAAALDAHKMSGPVLQIAETNYEWLRARPSLRPARLVLRHGEVEQF
jgi:hypothetical protein